MRESEEIATLHDLRSFAGTLIAIVARRMIDADAEDAARIVRLLQSAAGVEDDEEGTEDES